MLSSCPTTSLVFNWRKYHKMKVGLGAAGSCWELGGGSEAYQQPRSEKSGRGRDEEYVFFITQLMKGLFPG